MEMQAYNFFTPTGQKRELLKLAKAIFLNHH